MPRATVSLTCLLWVTLAGTVAAQSGLSSDPGVVSLQNYSGGVSLGGTYFQVQNITGNGVGWTNGYTQLGALTPYWVNEDFVLAANGRMIVTDTQQVGGNLGGFARYYNGGMDRIFGANAYYDIDHSVSDYSYRQSGIGVETLGRWWDFRANGYFPVTSGDNFLRPVGLTQNLTYSGHQIDFIGVGLYEQALTGGDFEFGRPVFASTPWLRAYGGMYLYNSKGVDPVGFRGRVEGWISDDLSLGVMVTEDRQFNTNVNAVVNFLFSGWKPTRWFPNFTTRERMLMPVQRQWRIAAGTYQQYVDIPAYNPRTHQPYFVTWVNNANTNPGPGDGTFENPLKTLPGSSPQADLILVQTGNTTAAAPLSGSIALTDYQRLLGEGLSHQINAYASYGNLSLQNQTYNLPGFTDTGNYPFLSGAPNLVTLANNNEVSAFNIINSPGAAITNTAAGSNNFDLNHLNLTNNAGGGIFLTNATGSGYVNNVNALNNAAGGIQIASGATPLSLVLDTVTSNGQAPGTQDFGIRLAADNSTIVATLNNVTTNGNTNEGIDLTETNSGIQAVLTNVTSSGNGTGLHAAGDGGYVSLTLTDVNTSGNIGRGIFVEGDNNAVIAFNYSNLTDNTNGDDNINFTLTNGSTLIGGGLHDAHFDSSTGGSGIVLSTDSNSFIGTAANPFTIQNTTANGNNQNGLQIIADGGSTQNIRIINGFFNNNGVDGINVTQTGGTAVVMNVDPTTVTGNGRDGLHLDITGNSSFNGTFNQTSFDNNGNAGVFGNIDDSLVTLSMIASTAQNTSPVPAGAQDFGMQFNLTSGSLLNVTAVDSNFSNNQQQGILANLDNSDAAFDLTNVRADGNGQDGFKTAAGNGSTVEINATNSSFSQNGKSGGGTGDGLDLAADNGSVVIASLDNTLVAGNNHDGVLATITNGSGIGLTTSDNTKIDDNLVNGIEVNAQNSTFQGEFSNTSVSHNGGNGVLYNANGNGPLDSFITFDTDSIYHNRLDNFTFNVTNGQRLALSAIDTNFSNSITQRGIEGYMSGAGTLVETVDPFFENVTADNNALEGMRLRVTDGATLNASVNGGSFSNNGKAAASDGVSVVVDNNGNAMICFDGTQANNNTHDGYYFNVQSGGTLYAALQTSGNFGTLTANNNTNKPFEFIMGAGTSGGLFMSGPNQFTGNGASSPITFVANGADVAVFSFTGDSDGNSGDGVNVQMTNVNHAFIDIHDGSTSDNSGRGIDIILNNVTFDSSSASIDFLQGTLTASAFNISNMAIDDNGDEGIKIDATNVTMTSAVDATIYGNSITNNGSNGVFDGIYMNVKGTSNITNFSIGDGTDANANTISGNTGNGVNVQLHDTSVIGATGTTGLTISGNTLTGNALNNILVNLADSSQVQHHIDNNTIDGLPTVTTFVTEQNFSGGTFSNPNGGGLEPPDTMGAVGPNDVVELINNGYFVYDKTGTTLASTDLATFWANAGATIPTGQSVFDPRIVYDPSINRWIATSITDGTSGVNNLILVAISNTDDPTAGWKSVQFSGETGMFNDYDTLGVNGSAVTISTNNYDASSVFQNQAIYSIPLADLTAATPIITNLTRLENISSSTVGFTMQPVNNFGSATGTTTLLSADYYTTPNGRLVETTVNGVAAAAATLGSSSTITGVPSFTAAPPAPQPGGTITNAGDTLGDRMVASVIDVSGNIWSAQAVQDTSGGAGIRWFEINPTTHAVMQTGLIENPNISYYMPSIAVNASGQVVIGMTGSGSSQPASSYAAYGTTTGGVTTFQTPNLLQAGVGTYNGGRWGDYSATVVDPSSSSSFWTFQEISAGGNNYAVQISEITAITNPTGTTTGDGIFVNASNNSQILNGSTINGNNVINNGSGNGIHVALNDAASAAGTLSINNNTASNNGLNGILATLASGTSAGTVHIDGNTASNNDLNGISFTAATGTSLSALSVNGPGDVSNNGLAGINVQLNATNNVTGVAGTPSISIDGTAAGRTINDNGTFGVNFLANNTPLTSLTISNNTITGSDQDGVLAALSNSAVQTITMSDNVIGANGGDGVDLQLTNSPVTTITMNNNLVSGNDGDGIDLIADTSAIGTLNITNSGIFSNSNDGIDLVLNNAPIGTLNISGNDQGDALSFFIAGDTFSQPFSITNSSTIPSVKITSYDFNIGTIPGFPDMNFDTDTGPIVNASAATPFTPDNGSEITTGLVTVNGTTAPNWIVNDESQDLQTTFNNFGVGKTFSWTIDVDQTFGGDEGVSGNQLIGATVTVNFSNGGHLSGQMVAVPNQPTASQFVASGVGISSNGDDGIHISQTNSTISNVNIANNTISANGDNGVNFATVVNSDIGSGVDTVVISGNAITANGIDGVRLVDPGNITNPIHIDMLNNTISANANNGVDFQFSKGQQLALDHFYGNTIASNGTSGTGSGVLLNVSGTGVNAASFNAQIGDSTHAANNFTGNVNGDGFTINMSGGSTGQLSVVNSNFTGNDQGLAITAIDSAALGTVTIGDPALANTSFNSNTGDGIIISIGSFVQSSSIDIENITASNNTSGGDGIEFVRSGKALFNSVTVNDSRISGNAGNGIEITAGGQDATLPPPPDTYFLTNNAITNNTGSGILFHQIADADIAATITGNTINGNGNSGILTTTTALATDTPTITLDIESNDISFNTGNGILIQTANSSLIGGSLAGMNLIEGNTADGIGITAQTFYTGWPGYTNPYFPDSVISYNVITNNGNDGISLSSTITSTSQSVEIDSNLIQSNTGDGVQIFASNGTNNEYTLLSNDIIDNGRRGINVVNAGGSNVPGSTATRTTLNIGDGTAGGANEIARNGLEGIYIINTSDAAQGNATNIDNFASADLLDGGAATAKPILNLNIEMNDLNSNGMTLDPSNFTGTDTTGLVLRVGTSDGENLANYPNAYTDNGGFASNNRGGVVATITDNTFAGNFGADVLFQPFISTVTPLDTAAGTWDNGATPPEFLVTGYQQDPLARLDLTFTGNAGDALRATLGTNADVFYNDADAVFKSRDTAQTDPGPFAAGGDRARNATRLASRSAPYNAPTTNIVGSTGQNSANFLYPGVGSSTFRVFGGGAFANGANSFGTLPNESFTGAVPIGGAIGELPFVWGTLP